MAKKRLLIIGPVSTQSSSLRHLSQNLSFLNPYYSIECLDPLVTLQECPDEEYYGIWQNQLKQLIKIYDAFVGFSFGGVILQQCFSILSGEKKQIILFSTPTFADSILREKLETVISLCSQNKLEEGLSSLYQAVYAPHSIPDASLQYLNRELAIKRLIFGLTKVLKTNCVSILNHCNVNHLHLIGEKSQLVNTNNVIKPSCGQLIVVPEASMRVLESNPTFCKEIIFKALNHEIH
ncbi:TPA: hypothetical protein RG395_001596 [Legionella pneumophila]|uniref:Uncharacterized protein n=1 Tax=Legionella pneumophila TaxID=446 RepID=A0A2S6EVC2_LEGPN|nr:hypothetical protein [Legionella pneumophila]APF04401.1 hypothetical protein BIZ52_13975 [Legionella pneumophila subsp. fraseri]APF07382.1 hypothetical protein BIZ51_13855 [Legionella pneumophila subsp. fraseri]AUB69837.1 hypothetical protein BJK09_13770 [Legionella pneumophila]AUB72812.1 hypothetical protein BJK08_13765 [Legionella pneumophila]KXB25809.1 hypothetical protein PtVF66_07365 [Legionella pneumophila]